MAVTTTPPAPALIAPDSFKGTFAAAAIAAAMARGCESAGVRADLCPVADGGEETAAALLAARGGERVATLVHDPLGRALEAEITMLGDGATAVVEVAAASGLALLAPERLDPWAASTRGTGEQILAAVELGARQVIVAAGGSATTDGGRGAIEVLAAAPGFEPVSLVVLCDVETPWERCASIFGPQKGADGEQVAALAARLEELARALPRDPRGLPMGGAAGGLSGGLWAAFGARLERGAHYVFEALGVRRRLAAAGFAITGEGRLDDQSGSGKTVGELARLAVAAGTPLHVVAGSDRRGPASGIGWLASVAEARSLPEIEAASFQIALTAAGLPR